MAESETASTGRPVLSAPEDSTILLQLASEAVAIGTWSCTLPAGPVLVDRRASEFLGLAPAQRLPVGVFLAAFPGEDREAVGRAIAGAAHRGGFTLEAQVVPSAARAPIRVRLVARVGPGEEGGPARLLGVVAPLRRREDSPAGVTHLAAIVASSGDAIIGTTLDGQVTSWNPAAETLFGYAEAEMLGHPVTVLAPPGYEDDMPGMLQRIRAGARIEHYETWRQRKDGGLLRVSLTVSPIYDPAGILVGASKVARDITAAHRTSEALRGAEARLAVLEQELTQVSRLGALGQLAAMLAHELNQPLTAITNYANAAQRLLAAGGEAAMARAREAMLRAAEQASRAGQIIRGLRAFAGGDGVERRPEALGPVVEEAARLASGNGRRAAGPARPRSGLPSGPGGPPVDPAGAAQPHDQRGGGDGTPLAARDGGEHARAGRPG